MKRALVVEDDRNSMRLIVKLLKSHGYEAVIEAKTGEEGVRLALEEKPGIILMDIKLPDIDGMEAAGRIRASTGDAKIIIIAITSYAMTGDREKYLEGGFDGHIEKPIDPFRIIEEIEEICQKK
ncbi:MAG: response regulator [Deltaproteobacteria bacterium]|nr:response regulator [Deltaproteobacteria bacterium]MBW2051323.1 response regulator [Deltaproteobacteria bacterium]MBW2141196.1 response regulator [Deltaproteobacteria bacterium]MBW2324494.1 response regulator [Deltaproteobacteria bacterium]